MLNKNRKLADISKRPKGTNHIDETDLTQEKQFFAEIQAKAVVAKLQKNYFNAQYVSSRQEALAAVMQIIPLGVKVARGDSITLQQIGIIPELSKRQQNVSYPFERDDCGNLLSSDIDEIRAVAKQAFSADVFLTGSNAVTLDGKLVNVDGWGNRVAPMLFGPTKVIVVAGVNKIVKDINEALERIRNYAAPMNAKRHYLKHHAEEFGDLPCVRTGKCSDCNSAWRICGYRVIIERGDGGTWEKGRINVVLVGEELGI